MSIRLLVKFTVKEGMADTFVDIMRGAVAQKWLLSPLVPCKDRLVLLRRKMTLRNRVDYQTFLPRCERKYITGITRPDVSAHPQIVLLRTCRAHRLISGFHPVPAPAVCP